MKILLANPRGFCAGVDRAITIVERALETLGAPIYVRNEIVHNRAVVSDLRARGAIFVEKISEVPAGNTVIFSAHGVSQAVRKEAAELNLKIFDATCPLVTKVHLEVARYANQNHECILIGHKGHPEVEGTLGQYHSTQGGIYLIESLEDVESLTVRDPTRVAYVTQTTLSVDDTTKIINALRQKFPQIVGPKKDDICYATQNRQDAVKNLAQRCDVLLVVGSVNSSNSNRLRELGERLGCKSYLIDDEFAIDSAWISDARVVGVTAGASAPESLVTRVVEKLRELGGELGEEMPGVTEDIVFVLPKELRNKATHSETLHHDKDILNE